MSSEALEARLDDLRQVCFAPGDAYSAGEWCEAANEGVQIALALLAALAVAREREQRAVEALGGLVAATERAVALLDAHDSWLPEAEALSVALRAARAALVNEPAADDPMCAYCEIRLSEHEVITANCEEVERAAADEPGETP